MHDEGGMTLVEMMVAIMLLSILVATFYSFLFGGERASRNGQEWLELNQTARLSLERLSRELREADSIAQISGASEVKFQADFDASGTFSGGEYQTDIGEDEKITYSFDSGTRELRIWSDQNPTPQPVARNVFDFSLTYFGSDPLLDCGSPPLCTSDGVVTAAEIDRFGNGNGVLDGNELNLISTAVVDMTVGLGFQRHEYRTAIELRNLFK